MGNRIDNITKKLFELFYLLGKSKSVTYVSMPL